jgi:acetolactate synthase-1/2/3 large subunit
LVNYGGNERPQLLLCLHEEVAVAFAHGYAKATGGVCPVVVHDLVGLMHASMAIFDAYCDQTPLVVLGGSGPVDVGPRRPIDWTHTAATQAELVRPFVKWDDEPNTPSAAVASLVRAYQISASAPTGPTYVSLDIGVQESAVSPDAPPVPAAISDFAPAPPIMPDPVAVARAAQLLCNARLPLIIGGRVGLDPASSPLLVELVELLGAAYLDDVNVVAFPTDHPHNCNGDREILGDADVVVAVDLANPATVRGPRGWPAAVVDISYGNLGLRAWSHAFSAPMPRAVSIVASPLAGLQSLIDAVREQQAPAGREQRSTVVRQRVAQLSVRLQAELQRRWEERPIYPGRMVAELHAALAEVDWLLLLRNTHTWPEGVWKFHGSGQYLGGSGGGGIGYGPGGAIGGALAARDRGQLGVGIIGDGDLLMASSALWTAVHYRIPVLLVINDNRSFYNDEEHQQRIAGTRGRPQENAGIGIQIDDPGVDIAALARSYGCWSEGPVYEPEDLRDVFGHAVEVAVAGGVAVVHVRVSPR